MSNNFSSFLRGRGGKFHVVLGGNFWTYGFDSGPRKSSADGWKLKRSTRGPRVRSATGWIDRVTRSGPSRRAGVTGAKVPFLPPRRPSALYPLGVPSPSCAGYLPRWRRPAAAVCACVRACGSWDEERRRIWTQTTGETVCTDTRARARRNLVCSPSE